MTRRYSKLQGFPELPDWEFWATEVSVNVYEVIARKGQTELKVVKIGDPIEDAIDECRTKALLIERGE